MQRTTTTLVCLFALTLTACQSNRTSVTEPMLSSGEVSARQVTGSSRRAANPVVGRWIALQINNQTPPATVMDVANSRTFETRVIDSARMTMFADGTFREDVFRRIITGGVDPGVPGAIIPPSTEARSVETNTGRWRQGALNTYEFTSRLGARVLRSDPLTSPTGMLYLRLVRSLTVRLDDVTQAVYRREDSDATLPPTSADGALSWAGNTQNWANSVVSSSQTGEAVLRVHST